MTKEQFRLCSFSYQESVSYEIIEMFIEDTYKLQIIENLVLRFIYLVN